MLGELRKANTDSELWEICPFPPLMWIALFHVPSSTGTRAREGSGKAFNTEDTGEHGDRRRKPTLNQFRLALRVLVAEEVQSILGWDYHGSFDCWATP